jgi:glycyl-tRNA synthetase beta chain
MTDLLFELGSEELPARFIGPALEDLERMFREQCTAVNLKHGAIRRFGTPRRIALLVSDVVLRTEDVTKEVLGPSVKAAYDDQGQPRVPATKFAQSVGASVEKLRRISTPKGEYLAADVEEKGRAALELLPDVLGTCIRKLNFPKSMRWGDVEQSFARPLHWIVALLGEEVVPVTFADVRSGRVTRGHRFLAPQPVMLSSPKEYELALERAHVVADFGKRRAMLVERITALAGKVGGALIDDSSLVDQVVNLVELPCPVAGRFDEHHLDLPAEVLVSEMKSHQRYFSLKGANGKLLAKFIAVSNTPVKDEALSIRGYERVLRARLTDGRFFFDEDKRTSLVDRVPMLHRVVWHRDLNSTWAEKVDRFRALAVAMATGAGHAAHRATIERAATLAKADLVTGMVGEFPELQGIMGREYALSSGEPPEVAQAIADHYLPRTSQDALPAGDAGAFIGLADRLDSVCGLFAVGRKPTGAADPYGLRRAAIATVNIILGKGYRLSLGEAVDESLRLLDSKVASVKRKAGDAPPRAQILDFFRGRLEALWSEKHRADVVEAVLSVGFDDLVGAERRLVALSAGVQKGDFAALAATFKRAFNIVEKQGKDVAKGAVDPSRLIDASEKTLFAQASQVRDTVKARVEADDFAGALEILRSLKPHVDRFFDGVMVMAEDPAVRVNRLRLLMDVCGLFSAIADFGKLQAEA